MRIAAGLAHGLLLALLVAPAAAAPATGAPTPADDWSLDAKNREWVVQALRDITGQTLAHDASAWRQWYAAGHPVWNPVTRDGR